MEIRYSKQAIKFLGKQEESVGSWEAVESVEPDEIDMQMIREAQSDPDCSTFASDAEVRAVLG